MKCPECGSEKLTWDEGTQNLSGVQDGRLRQNEVHGIFFLGCDECSETVSIVPASKVANYLNAQGVRSLD